MKVLLVSLAIIGTIIGSGFISGKEIVVFFSNFGLMSFFCIILVFILFFYLFRLLLNYNLNEKGQKNSKFLYVLNIILSFVFSSAMFAGISDIANDFSLFVSIPLYIFVLLICYFIFKKGQGGLNKINIILIPFMICIFVFCIISKIEFKPLSFENALPPYFSFFYALLYVVLNISNSNVLISNLGKNLSNKQKTRVAFISALVLFLILTLANIVLLQNQASFVQEMPLLSLFSGYSKIIMTLVIFIGCLTTLFSLVYSTSLSMRGLCKSEYMTFFVSVIMPFIMSLAGFSNIIMYFYPLASVLGAILLFELFFNSFFKRANKKIHSSGKNTK